MLKYRLISAFVLIPIVIAIIFLLPSVGFVIIISIISLLSAWEWGLLSDFKSSFERSCLTVFYGFLLILILFLLKENYFNITNQVLIFSLFWFSSMWWLIALVLVIFYPNPTKLWRYSKILRIIFGSFVLIPFFLGMIVLRLWHFNNFNYNNKLGLLYIIILVWSTDSGSFIFGKLLGKHNLIPKISPKKTWQGLIGGIFTAFGISYIYNIWINFGINKSILLICSILTILASVIGDLTESMFKREAGIKDSGHLIPGHGGILDRIDSLLAAVPVFTFLLFLLASREN